MNVTPVPQPELDAVSARMAFCASLIRDAGELARQGFEKQAHSAVMTKGPQDFLTETDLAVEKFIRAKLAEAYPEDGFFGEETGQVEGEALWIVDPIDGTANFARGVPHYCIAIAFVQAGRVLFGAIYAPSTDELYLAQAGQGATRNGQPLQVAPTDKAEHATLELGWSNRRGNAEYLQILAVLLDAGVNVRRASSGALALAYVADGRSDGYAEMHMNPWDCLAGQLLVAEAGGVVGGTALMGDLTEGGSVLAAAPGIAPLLTGASGIKQEKMPG